jgi:glycosyltransferase involved in cell wall biosynthesis
MKIAVVHEWLVDWAGSEQVLQQILACYPDADLFSLVDFLPDELRGRVLGKRATTSFLQRMPFARAALWRYLPLMPFAMESLDLSGYDLVISSSHAVAKGVVTSAQQIHVSYVHSPMRYAWDLEDQYLRSPELDGPLRRFVARRIFRYLRNWDVRTSANPDALAANSKFVAQRIARVWKRSSRVIWPPVDTGRFLPGAKKGDFFLCASRLHYYKRFDVIVEAFASLPDQTLVVIGDGPERKRLESMAPPNVTFLGYQTDERLIDHLQRANALLFAAEEDFGILPVEAQACGTPVIAFGSGGALETVRGLDEPEPTGVFFSTQASQDVVLAVRTFLENRARFAVAACRANALRFGIERFRDAFRGFVDDVVAQRKSGGPTG